MTVGLIYAATTSSKYEIKMIKGDKQVGVSFNNTSWQTKARPSCIPAKSLVALVRRLAQLTDNRRERAI